MKITKQGAKEELERLLIHPERHVAIGRGRNDSVEIRVTSNQPGISQMLKEHFARYTNVNIEWVGPIRLA
jgi:hypothetical protein